MFGSACPLNEGRGINPGDTPRRLDLARPTRESLNEGRGINPGDTSSVTTYTSSPMCAQRRPGHQPRRHWTRRHGTQQTRSNRSTKAGASTPATPRPTACTSEASGPLNEGRGINPGDTRFGLGDVRQRRHAQRRPGHQPRRHSLLLLGRVRLPVRSTKAGASTPATPGRSSA